MPTRSKSIVVLDYQGHSVSYQGDGWFNATQAATKFGKLPNEWLRLPSTVSYLNAFRRKYGKIPHLRIKRGTAGGTWLHPKLAVAFSRWLDDDFAVWCDDQIDSLIRGNQNWHAKRHAIASSSKVMSGMLDSVRQQCGKETGAHHHMCEHKLINSLLTGEYKGLDRECLAAQQLDFLAHFEVRNSILIGLNLPYEKRKETLLNEVVVWKRQLQSSNDHGKLAA